MNILVIGGGGREYGIVKKLAEDPRAEKLYVLPGNGGMEDIAECFPGRTWDVSALDRAYLVYHGDEAAGILMGSEQDGVLDIALDYTTPTYRDASVGRYLLDHLPNEKLSVLQYKNAEPDHLSFLNKMGYTEQNGVYQRKL